MADRASVQVYLIHVKGKIMPSVKNREATVIIKAYDGTGEVLDQLETHSRLTPSVQLLEFQFQVEDCYPHVVRYEMTIAY